MDEHVKEKEKRSSKCVDVFPKAIKHKMSKNKLFQPCCGFFLQGSAKETAIASSFVAVASMIIFAVSIGDYMNGTYYGSPRWNQYLRPIFWFCYYIYWTTEIYLAIMLFEASCKRDYKECKRCLKAQKVFYMMNLLVYIVHAFGLPQFTKATQAMMVVTAIYKLYSFWVIHSFMAEIKGYGSFNVPLTRLTDEDVEDFLEGFCDSRGWSHADYDPQALPCDTSFEIESFSSRFSSRSEWTKIGKGQFGVVFKATTTSNDFETCEKLLPAVVAVKTVDPLITDVDQFKTLLAELKIRTFIGNHENIVRLIGACTADIRNRKLDLVVEFCSGGCLKDFLPKTIGFFNNQISGASKSQLSAHPYSTFGSITSDTSLSAAESASTTDLLQWALQVARGMEYLQSIKVIHGDLAIRNILLTGDRTAKITDFGLSRRVYSYKGYVKSKQKYSPWRTMAPESLGRRLIFSLESDIWSYGVTIWEIFSLAKEPFAHWEFTEAFVTELKKGMALPCPVFMPATVNDVMLECMKVNPNERSNFYKIIYQLTAILHDFNSQESLNGADFGNSKEVEKHTDTELPNEPCHTFKDYKPHPTTTLQS